MNDDFAESANKFKFFDILTINRISEKVTTSHWILLLGLVDKHAKMNNHVDIIGIHALLDGVYNNLIKEWIFQSSLGDVIESNMDSIDTNLYTLDDLDLLLDMWKDIVIQNEVFEMIPSIDFAKEYIQHIKKIRQQEQRLIDKRIEEKIKYGIDDDKSRFKIFESLSHIAQGATSSEWEEFIALIEDDAIRRTGNINTFRHDEIGNKIYPKMLCNWYSRSSIDLILSKYESGFKTENIDMLDTKSMNQIIENHIENMDQIIQNYKVSLSDLDVLLDEMQDVMEKNDMHENIPSIDLARDFLMDIRLRKDMVEIDPKVSME